MKDEKRKFDEDELPFQELNELSSLVNRIEWRQFLALMKKHIAYCNNQALLYIEKNDEREAYAWRKCAKRGVFITNLVKNRIQELRKEGEK